MKKTIITLGILGFVFVASAQTATKAESAVDAKKVETIDASKKATLQAPSKATKVKSAEIQKANLSTTNKKAVLISGEQKIDSDAVRKKEVVAEPKKIENSTK